MTTLFANRRKPKRVGRDAETTGADEEGKVSFNSLTDPVSKPRSRHDADPAMQIPALLCADLASAMRQRTNLSFVCHSVLGKLATMVTWVGMESAESMLVKGQI
jgi:hypothetical protein